MAKTINIDHLIQVVSRGGTVKTGVDFFNDQDVLLIKGNVPIRDVSVLLNIKRNSAFEVPVDPKKAGGMWDKNGRQISPESLADRSPHLQPRVPSKQEKIIQVEHKLKEIAEVSREAKRKYHEAKASVKKTIESIKKTGGQFDYDIVEKTVSDLFNFLTRNDNAFCYLSKEIFSYDDYLYNHSINVCTIGTAVLRKFNTQFGSRVNNFLANLSDDGHGETPFHTSFIYYLPEELHEIAIGYFLHDMGKVLIEEKLLNKEGPLTAQEFAVIKEHSYKNGPELLKKNNLKSIPITNIVTYHHCRLFPDEERCYPENKLHIELPTYVKICKLSDIYDAMTSKRSYKEAENPIRVVTDLFRRYADKDHMLQLILHTFVNVVGIYPPGSVVCLQNGQFAFIMDSTGPIIIPFTDPSGSTLKGRPDPIDLSDEAQIASEMNIDRRKPLKSPAELYSLLPQYLKASVVRPA